MTADQFCSCACLTENMTVRNYSEQGEKVHWLKIQCLQVRKLEPSKLYYKYSVQPDVPFSSINVAKAGRRFDISHAQLIPLCAEPRCLSAEKAADIRKLLKYVPPVHHSFYEAIISQVSAEATEHSFEDEVLNVSETEDDQHLQEKTVPASCHRQSSSTVSRKRKRSARKS